MRPFTITSLAVHVGGTLLISSFVSPPQKPVFAEPIYSVAFYEAPETKPATPRPVKRVIKKEQTPPPEPKKEEVKTTPLNEVPVKPKEKTPVKKKEPEKQPEEKPLKAPAKRPEEPVPDTQENTLTKVDDISLGMVDQKDFRHNYYLERVRALLASKWRAPAGQSGVQKATVHFYIERNGSVRGIEVREGSGSSSYDRTAMNTVRAVDRFPPLPQSYAGNQIGISVVFQTVRGGEE